MNHLYLPESLLPTLFFLFGIGLTTACNSSFHALGKHQSKEIFRSKNPPLFFFRPILKRFISKNEWDNLYFCLALTKHICQLSYGVFGLYYLFIHSNQNSSFLVDKNVFFFTFGALLLGASLTIDFVSRLVGTLKSRTTLKLFSPLTSIYLLFCFPITLSLLGLSRLLIQRLHTEEGSLLDKTKIREMLTESELHQHLDANDQKLFSSLLNFRERVSKEIMVPRVDIYSLPSSTPIEEAACLFALEGYSRIPIYKDSLDHIEGVVLYKDLLKYYTRAKANLNSPLSILSKPVLYTPENKKISQLLQEFRTKQIHMAIVVDEYGGTEGIVTIEDILEELVGKIEDEYDVGIEQQFLELPDGGWVIDAKMTLIDIEEQLGIKVPESPEYETIGGYIYHHAGTIPPKGWRLSHDAFELEVLSSNERSIKKIKIVPRARPSSSFL